MIRRLAYATVLILVFVSRPSFAAPALDDNDEIVFDFNKPSDYKDWGASSHNLSATVKDGQLFCAVESDNESGGLYFIAPLAKPFDAAKYPIMEARIKSNKNYQFDLYWLDDVDNNWVSHSAMVQLVGDMYYRTIVTDLSKTGNWRNRIQQLRLGVTTYKATGAPQAKKGDMLILDYIKFKKFAQPQNTLECLNLWEKENGVVRLYNQALQTKVNYKGKLEAGDGTVAAKFEGQAEGSKGMVEVTFSTKGVAPGPYTLRIEAFGEDGVKLAGGSTPFEKLLKPVWLKMPEQRQVNEVPPPWTPLKTADREVRCIQRTYRFQDLPFPAQITSKGEEMLAAPIALKGTIGGKEIEWGKGNFGFTEQKDYKVSYKTSCDGNVAAIEGSSYIEFDGMMWFDFTLKLKDPQARLDHLYLDIPLKKANSLYYWLGGVSWDAYRWGAFDVKSGTKKFIFMPYVTVSDDERGLCWFTESDENWSYDQKDAVELITQESQNTVRINLVNVPYVPGKPEVKFAFGLQATPAKPYPQDPNDHPGRYCMTDVHSGTGFYAYDKELLARKYRIQTIAYTLFSDRTMDFDPGPGEQFDRTKKVIGEYNKVGIKVLPYTCLENINIKDEGLLRYGDEWMTMMEGRWNPRPIRMAYDVYPDFYPVSTASECWHDYFLWKMEQAIDKFGVQGVYLDCSDPGQCWNPYLGCGYVDRKGEIKPTLTIRKSRELMKRLYLLKKQKKDFLIEFHMSTMPIVPTHTFADMYMDGEQFISKPVFFELSLEKFRAEFMGQPWGIPCNLWICTGNVGMPGYFDNEKALAFAILHGTQINMEPSMPFFDRVVRLNDVMDKFQVGRAELFSYWKNKKVIRLNTKEAAANVYKKPGEALVVLSNLRKNDLEVNVQLDWAALGLSGDLYAKDYLDDQLCKIENGKFTTSLTTEIRVKIFHIGSKDKLVYPITRQPTVAEFMGDFSKSNFPPAWDKMPALKEFVSRETLNGDNQFTRLTFDLPAGKKYQRLYWGIEARLTANSNPQGNGTVNPLRVSVNGRELTDVEDQGKGNLVGKSKTFHTASGLTGGWYDLQKRAWSLSAYSGFTLPTERRYLSYRPVRENPFTYVFDITDLVKPGENTLGITIDKKVWPSDVFFKTIAVKGE